MALRFIYTHDPKNLLPPSHKVQWCLIISCKFSFVPQFRNLVFVELSAINKLLSQLYIFKISVSISAFIIIVKFNDKVGKEPRHIWSTQHQVLATIFAFHFPQVLCIQSLLGRNPKGRHIEELSNKYKVGKSSQKLGVHSRTHFLIKQGPQAISPEPWLHCTCSLWRGGLNESIWAIKLMPFEKIHNPRESSYKRQTNKVTVYSEFRGGEGEFFWGKVGSLLTGVETPCGRKMRAFCDKGRALCKRVSKSITPNLPLISKALKNSWRLLRRAVKWCDQTAIRRWALLLGREQMMDEVDDKFWVTWSTAKGVHW